MTVTVEHKTCTHCKTTKPAEGFWKRTASDDGLQAWCKDCSRASYDPYKERRICSTCHKEKSGHSFGKRKDKEGNKVWNSVCTDCRSKNAAKGHDYRPKYDFTMKQWKEYLLLTLVDAKEKSGRVPTQQMAKEGMFSLEPIKEYNVFGNWTNALRVAKLIPAKNTPVAEEERPMSNQTLIAKIREQKQAERTERVERIEQANREAVTLPPRPASVDERLFIKLEALIEFIDEARVREQALALLGEIKKATE